MTNDDGHLLLDAIEIERQRNRMIRQTMLAPGDFSR